MFTYNNSQTHTHSRNTYTTYIEVQMSKSITSVYAEEDPLFTPPQTCGFCGANVDLSTMLYLSILIRVLMDVSIILNALNRGTTHLFRHTDVLHMIQSQPLLSTRGQDTFDILVRSAILCWHLLARMLELNLCT